MGRMSRVGRQHEIFMTLLRMNKKHPNSAFRMSKIAHSMGLKSSTYIKNILNHMVEIGLIEKVSFGKRGNADPEYGYKIFIYQQMPLPPHEIIINGKREYLS
jgi:predicted transcriptional regulator